MAAGEHRPFLMVLFYTMARIDEILRLRWEDVNFQERIVKLWTKKNFRHLLALRPVSDGRGALPSVARPLAEIQG